MKLFNIHRILKFKQSDWLKNTLILTLIRERMLAIALKGIFFKLMNNSAYGKSIEILRNRVKFRLVNNAKDYKK